MLCFWTIRDTQCEVQVLAKVYMRTSRVGQFVQKYVQVYIIKQI